MGGRFLPGPCIAQAWHIGLYLGAAPVSQLVSVLRAPLPFILFLILLFFLVLVILFLFVQTPLSHAFWLTLALPKIEACCCLSKSPTRQG